MKYLTKNIFEFLLDISKNNNRDWFMENKQRYIDIKKNLERFASLWHSELMKINKNFQNPNICPYIFRIYRDARFSKWKSYKDNFWILLVDWWRSSLHSRAWFYLHIQNWNCFLVWWSYIPDSEWLNNIRNSIYKNPEKFKNIIENKNFKNFFTLEWRKLKTAPRGYSKDNKFIDLINYKDYYAFRKIEDNEILEEDFLSKLTTFCEKLFDFNNYLNLQIKE